MDTTREGGGITARLQSATQEILAVTYWFDPAPNPGPYPVTVRFSGRRVDVKGRLSPGDRFVQDETIEEVVPGSGPISLTARIRGINAGSWAVTAHMLRSTHPARGPREQANETLTAGPPGPAARLWRKWAPSAGSVEPVSTCLTPFARVPGILPGIWGALVMLGIAVTFALQSLVIASDHLAAGPWWVVSLVAIVVGIVGAKVWFIVLHRRAHRMEGWCIQGFIVGATLAAAILLVVLDMPIGVLLDMTAPGLLVAIAVGGMLLRWLLWRAADCVPVGSLVIRSTRGGASYSNTTAGVGARGDTGALSAGGSGGSWTGGRGLLHWRAGGLYPGATRSAASTR